MTQKEKFLLLDNIITSAHITAKDLQDYICSRSQASPKKSAKNKRLPKHPHLIVDATGRIIGLNQFLTKEGAEILLNSTSNNIFSKVNQKNT